MKLCKVTEYFSNITKKGGVAVLFFLNLAILRFETRFWTREVVKIST